MVTRRDYGADAVDAARRVLVELVHLLGENREHAVLVGGWVPELLLARPGAEHTGSTDVDLALDHRKIQDDAYRTIQQLLIARGYRECKQPFSFTRIVNVRGREIAVQVDFLAGEYEGTGKGHRTQSVQDIRARKVRGWDLAFDMAIEVRIEGELPNGAKDSVTVRVASIVPFLVMKGMALEDRLKEKDAWDIWYCLRNYPGGTDALADEFEPHLAHGLVREGLDKIARAFSSEGAWGPKAVADFEEVEDPEERQRIERDTFERVNALLGKLKVID